MHMMFITRIKHIVVKDCSYAKVADGLDGCIFIVFNATFNNISVISWRPVLLVEETGEKHQPVISH